MASAPPSNDFATLTGTPTLHNVDAPTNDNPYAAAVAEPAQAADLAIRGTAAGNPETAGKNNALSRESGVPTSIVAADPDAIRAQIRTVQAQMATTGDPSSAAWASNPDHAAVAHGDWPTLTRIGTGIANFVKALPSAVTSGVESMNAGLLGAVRAAVENTPRDPVTYAIDQITGTDSRDRQKPLINVLTRAQTYEKKLADASAPKGNGFVADNLLGGVSSIPLTIGAVAATMAAGPEAGAALFGASAGGEAYGEARDAGQSPATAFGYGATQGGIMAASQVPALGFLEKGLGKLGLPQFMAGLLGREVPSQAIAAAAASFEHAYWLDPTLTPDKWLATLPKTMAEAAVQTIGMGIVGGAAHVAFSRAGSGITASEQAASDATALDGLAKATSESQTRTRDATAFQAFLDAHAAGTPVEKMYVNGDAIRELYQSARIEPGSPDDNLFGFQPDIREQLAQAGATGGDVVLDTAAALTHLAGTPAWDAIKPDVRVRPDGLSMRDVEDHSTAFDDVMEKSGQDAAAADKAARDQAAPQQRVYDDVLQQAKEAGFGTNAASTYADLYAARYQARAEATGTDAWSAYRASNVSIRTELPESVQPYAKADNLDVLINAMKRGAEPEAQGSLLGPSLLEHLSARGPLVDTGGDLKVMGADNWHREKPFRRKLYVPDTVPGDAPNLPANAQRIDDAALHAWENGYFPEHTERPAPNDLLNAIDDELRGKPRYSEQNVEAETAQHGMAAAADDLRAMLEQRGVDTAKASHTEIRKAVDQASADAGRTLGQSAVSKTDTPEFKRWFGDSKVVKSDGSPMVMYHGSINKKGVDAFDKKLIGRANDFGFYGTGFYFTSDRQVATDYVPVEGGKVESVYLSLQNPFVWDLTSADAEHDTIRRVKTAWPDGKEAVSTTGIIGAGRDRKRAAAFTAALQKAGHDGLVIMAKDVPADWRGSELEGHAASEALPRKIDEAVAFEPAQIKSIHNDGAFNPNSPFILRQDNRGSITFDDAGAAIKLFANHDLSTLLHETGHNFLEELKFDATSNGATEQLRADYKSVTDWFAEHGHAVGEDGEIPTDAHELFARGFEKFLMEGKAPSSALGRAFATFRSWLLRIYQLADRLQSPISDPVREVMQRLLATQDQIDAVNAKDRNTLLFTDAKQAGMTDAEFAAYRGSVDAARTEAMNALVYRTMETVRRQRTAEWEEQRASMRDDVAAEVARRPEFKAIDLMRGNGVERMPLDRSAIVDRYGNDALSLIPKGVPPTIVERGGVHPDLLAEMVGLGSGDELVDRLMGVERRNQELKAAGDKRNAKAEAIDLETDRQMSERHGDPLADGSIEEEARSAIHNDIHAGQIASELRALARLTSKSEIPTPIELARQWAERTVRSGTVREQTTAAALARHQRAESKAARAAEKAMLAGDADEAFRQKQAQLLNNALYRAAKDAKDAVETIATRLGKLAKAKTLKSMDQDYLDRIHGLLEAYDFKRRTGPAIDERAAFAAFKKAKDAAGEEVYEPPRLLDAEAVNYKSMTVDDLTGLDDAVASLAHLGRRKKQLLVAKAEAEFDDFVRSAVDAAAPLPNRKFSADRNQRTGLVGRIAADLTRVEFMADEMDGFDPNGPFNRILVQGATEAANVKDRLRKDVLEPIAREYEALADKARLQERVTVPEFLTRHSDGSGEPTVFRRMDLLAVALNTGTESNLDKMVRGEGWSPGTVDTVLARELNADDWKFVQRIWDQVGSLWPDIARVERELSGVVPEKVVGRTVSTPHGDFTGGYYPLSYDPTRSDFARQLHEGDGDSMFGQQGRPVSTPKGHTVARTDFAAPLNLSLESVLLNHIDRVTTRIAYGRYVRDTLKFINDPRIKNTFDAKRGPDDYNRLLPWLKGQVNDARGDTVALHGINNILKQARINATIVGLGLRLTTIVQHVSYLANAASEIGPGWLMKGVGATLKGMGSNSDFVFAKSEEMAGRAHSYDANVRDAFRQMGQGRTGNVVHDKVQAGVEAVQKVAFWPMGQMLLHVIAMPTWLGAYQKGLSEGMTDADASAYGDKAVRRSSGGGRAKDLSAFQQGNEGMRQLGMFYSYFGVLFNQQREMVRASARGDWRKAANTAFWFMAVEPIVVSMFKGDLPKEDEDWGAWVLRKMFFGLWGGLPLVRDVASGAEKMIANHVSARDAINDPIPVLHAGSALLTNVEDAVKAGHGEPSSRWIQHAIETPGYFFGLPTGQLSQTVQYGADVSAGRQHPKSAGQVLRGVEHGPQKDQE